MKKFTPVSFDLVEEGRLKQSLDESIADATRTLIAHVQKYGPDVTAKAKAIVSLKLTVQVDNPAEGDYSLKGEISLKMPGRPSHTTKAIHEIDDDGVDTLFVRASGSTNETPLQQRLATEDGRPIDLATGKVAPPAPDAKKG